MIHCQYSRALPHERQRASPPPPLLDYKREQGLKPGDRTLGGYDRQNRFAILSIATLRGPCIVLFGGLRTSEREFQVDAKRSI